MILVIVILIVLILIYACVRKPDEKKQQDEKGVTQSIQNQLAKDLANYEPINHTDRKMVDCELKKATELSLKKVQTIEEIRRAGREAEDELRKLALMDVNQRLKKP